MRFKRTYILPILILGSILTGCNKEVDAQVNTVKAPDYYPLFSWETVPIAFHFGNMENLLSNEEAAFVASKSSITVLEKGHGLKAVGSTEKGIEAEAIKLKKLNPEMKVIFYWNAFLDYALYDAHEEYNKHPEWWLTKLDGQPDLKQGRIKRYDLSNEEVRAWWTSVAKKAVVNGSTDGVFMDAFNQVMHPSNVKLWGQEKYDAIQQGLASLVQETRESIGEDKLIIYNGIRSTPSSYVGDEFPEYTDALMLEHFAHFNSRTKECMLQDIIETEKAGKNGKIVFFKAWPGFSWLDAEWMNKPIEEKRIEAQKNLEFALAAYLVAAQEFSFFTYNWGYRLEYGCLEWYPEFDRPLGKPLGDMTKKGWILSREFEHVSVWINLESKVAKIEWRNDASQNVK